MAYGRGAAAVKAIEDVSLEIARGEFIAVVGPSGCGKSSLMRLISGLHPPAAGALTVEGKPVDGPLKSVGMAFQNSNLLPWRNALENVLLPLEIVEPYRRDFSSRNTGPEPKRCWSP
jgi:NitT/TauT family transport system ATP-binding protein